MKTSQFLRVVFFFLFVPSSMAIYIYIRNIMITGLFTYGQQGCFLCNAARVCHLEMESLG